MKHVYCLRTHMENHWLYMSLDTWNSLSADEQATVTKLAKDWEAEAYQLAKDNESKYNEMFVEKGVEVYEPSQEVVDAYADYVHTNVCPRSPLSMATSGTTFWPKSTSKSEKEGLSICV